MDVFESDPIAKSAEIVYRRVARDSSRVVTDQAILLANPPSQVSDKQIDYCVSQQFAITNPREGPMPKQKTHKGTKKRFRLTAKGHAKHRQSGTSHLQSRMSQKRKRDLRGTSTTAECNEPRIREALGKYSS